jgi:hypothetical protein
VAAAAGTGTGLGVFGTANTWSSRSLLLLAATGNSALCAPAALRAASASSWIFRLAARFFLSAGRKGSGNKKTISVPSYAHKKISDVKTTTLVGA